MKIDHENIQPDGSAFTASVYVRGVLYIVSYVNHKLLVKIAPYKQPPARARWYLESVEVWAKKRLAELPEAFFVGHAELYGPKPV